MSKEYGRNMSREKWNDKVNNAVLSLFASITVLVSGMLTFGEYSRLTRFEGRVGDGEDELVTRLKGRSGHLFRYCTSICIIF